MEAKSMTSNHGAGIIARPIIKKKWLRKNDWKKNHKEEVTEKESWRGNHGGARIEEEVWRTSLGSMWELSGANLGWFWKSLSETNDREGVFRN